MKTQRTFRYRRVIYLVIPALFLAVSLTYCLLRTSTSGVGTRIAQLETEIAKIQLEPPIAQQVSSQGTVVSYLATIVGSIQLTSGPYTTHPRAETPTAYIPAGSVR